MSEKTWRQTDTTDQIHAAVVRAVKVLKGSHEINIRNVSAQAGRLLHGKAPAAKRYLESLDTVKLVKLGFPDPNEQKLPAERVLRGDMGVVRRLQVPLGRR